jgi:glutamate-1-semialdehyde 2,1-aminomutase
MFSLFFRDGAVRDYDDARAQHLPVFTAFFHSMLGQGVHLPPSAFEAWFVSAAHDERAVGRVLDAIPAAAGAAAEAFASAGTR